MAAEVHLRAGIGPAAFQRTDHAFTELGVEDRPAQAQTGRLAGTDDAGQASAALPGVLVFTRTTRAKAQAFESAPLPVHVVHHEGRRATQKVRAFVDMAVERLRRDPGLR